jgi:uncharacterized protein YbaP (TraB family)
MVKFIGKLLFVASVLLGANDVCAQKKSNATKEVKQTTTSGFKISNSVLYKVSGNGLQSPSYFLGTIHMICEDKYKWSEKIDNALKNTKQVAVELDVLDPKISMALGMGMMAKDGKKLSSYFDEEEQAILSKMLKEQMNVTLEQLDPMSPAILVSLFAQQAVKCSNGIESYDVNVLKKAKEYQYKIISLDDAEVQLEVLNSLASDSAEFAKMKTKIKLQDKDSASIAAEIQFNQLMNLYQEEKIADLEPFFMKNLDFNPTLEKQLLNNRNEDWIGRLEKLMMEESTFVAVGIGHFFGNNSIFNLLKLKGYTIEPVY